MLAVGTPGRLAELSREGVLQTHRTPALVLDEVDQLLAPNFREDLSRILEHTGEAGPGRGACIKLGLAWDVLLRVRRSRTSASVYCFGMN